MTRIKTKHIAFFPIGILLIFAPLFVYLFYGIRIRPTIPVPPSVNPGFLPDDTISYANTLIYRFGNDSPAHQYAGTDTSIYRSYPASLVACGMNSKTGPVVIPIRDPAAFQQLAVSAWIRISEGSTPTAGWLMVQFTDSGNRVTRSFMTDVSGIPKDTWTHVSGSFSLADNSNKGGELLKIYLVNRTRGCAYLDDLRISAGRRSHSPDSNRNFVRKKIAMRYLSTGALAGAATNRDEGKFCILPSSILCRGRFGPGPAESILVTQGNRFWTLQIKNSGETTIRELVMPSSGNSYTAAAADTDGDGMDELIIGSGSPFVIDIYSSVASGNGFRKVKRIETGVNLPDPETVSILSFFSENGIHLLIRSHKKMLVVTPEKPFGGVEVTGQDTEYAPAATTELISGRFGGEKRPGLYRVVFLHENEISVQPVIFDGGKLRAGRKEGILQCGFPVRGPAVFRNFDADSDGRDELLIQLCGPQPGYFLLKSVGNATSIFELIFEGYPCHQNPLFYEENLCIAGNILPGGNPGFLFAGFMTSGSKILPASVAVYQIMKGLK